MGRKIVKSVRLDEVLSGRVDSYCKATGMRESNALRDLIEKGLACEVVNVFATPIGSLVRNVVEAELSLLRAELQERNDELENRVARVCSRGTKASIQTSVQLNEVSRTIIPAWQEVTAEGLYAYYARIAASRPPPYRHSNPSPPALTRIQRRVLC